MSSGHLNAQYNLRWPEGLKEKVAQSAKDHNRSMNADIVARLEQSFEPKKTDKSDLTTEELMEELANRFGGLQINISPSKQN
ncbi:Arc family DNA-binding protein [Acinetobacter soli]|uniref:Arc family DNA-binding protein n=1 Tax=Acinetobacter soli TaxID=487316 RepID=UPI001250BDD8|nr:Arc family DNA-binding protein [Acinetobacter soli]